MEGGHQDMSAHSGYWHEGGTTQEAAAGSAYGAASEALGSPTDHPRACTAPLQEDSFPDCLLKAEESLNLSCFTASVLCLLLLLPAAGGLVARLSGEGGGVPAG